MQRSELSLKAPLLTRSGWSAFIIALLVVCALAPVLNLVVPQGSLFHMSDYAVALVGKIMCYAIAALAMDLIWGYTGILSLGHGLFFALGGYVMGMYLMRQNLLRAGGEPTCKKEACGRWFRSDRMVQVGGRMPAREGRCHAPGPTHVSLQRRR